MHARGSAIAGPMGSNRKKTISGPWSRDARSKRSMPRVAAIRSGNATEGRESISPTSKLSVYHLEASNAPAITQISVNPEEHGEGIDGQ